MFISQIIFLTQSYYLSWSTGQYYLARCFSCQISLLACLSCIKPFDFKSNALVQRKKKIVPGGPGVCCFMSYTFQSSIDYVWKHKKKLYDHVTFSSRQIQYGLKRHLSMVSAKLLATTRLWHHTCARLNVGETSMRPVFYLEHTGLLAIRERAFGLSRRM